MRRRYLLFAGLLVLAIPLVSCNAIHQMQGTLLDLQKVQTSLAKSLGPEEIRVFLNNGHSLDIAVVNSPLKSLPAVQKQAKALEIAKLAYTSYPSRSALAAVRVTFAVHRSYAGVVNFNDATDGFNFEIPQLTASNTPVP